MTLEIQEGKKRRFFAEAAITGVIGKGVCYGTGTEKVVIGTAALGAAGKFAGVVATVSGSNSGNSDAAIGDAMTVVTDYEMEVTVVGDCAFGDPLKLLDNGKFGKLTYTATPTTSELMSKVATAMEAQTLTGGPTEGQVKVKIVPI